MTGRLVAASVAFEISGWSWLPWIPCSGLKRVVRVRLGSAACASLASTSMVRLPSRSRPDWLVSKTHAKMATVLLRERLQGKEFLGLEHVDAGHDIAIASTPAACSGK